MDRILDIPPEDRTPEQIEVVNALTAGRGRILTPYRVWIHSPRVAAGMEKIGTYLNTQSTLSRREVEIGIILIARHWGGDYVLHAHLREGRKTGLDDVALDALRSGTPVAFADPHEQAVYDFVSATLAGDIPSDADFTRYEHILTRAGIAEVLILIGYYSSVSLAMKVHCVEPKP